jgi:hypothetical protein
MELSTDGTEWVANTNYVILWRALLQHNRVEYTNMHWSKHSHISQLSDHRLSTKLVPTFADRGCHVVSTMDPHGRILATISSK